MSRSLSVSPGSSVKQHKKRDASDNETPIKAQTRKGGGGKDPSENAQNMTSKPQELGRRKVNEDNNQMSHSQ
jgi:hypothetical protein